MKRLFLLLVLIPTTILGQTREKEVNERIDYFKLHPIFVTQLTIDERVIKKRDKEVAKSQTETINKNLRTAFTTFWDINDTVTFVFDNELKAKKKEFKASIFFELVKLAENTDDNGRVSMVLGFKLFRPNSADYFKNVFSLIGVDTSLVNIVTQVRQLKLNVIAGTKGMFKKDMGRKTILINKDDQRNRNGDDYFAFLRSKYESSMMEVDNRFVLDVIMRKDPKYIYVKNGSSFDAADGTMILH